MQLLRESEEDGSPNFEAPPQACVPIEFFPVRGAGVDISRKIGGLPADSSSSSFFSEKEITRTAGIREKGDE